MNDNDWMRLGITLNELNSVNQLTLKNYLTQNQTLFANNMLLFLPQHIQLYEQHNQVYWGSQQLHPVTSCIESATLTRASRV